jgi:two-component system CheB/CheR fusion protein
MAAKQPRKKPATESPETQPKRPEPPAAGTEESAVPPIDLADVTRQLLLELFAPAAVLINRKSEILYFFGPCAKYLEFPSGKPTHDLIRMVRHGLRTKLEGAIHRAILDNKSVTLSEVRVRRDGGHQLMRVTVHPVKVPKATEGLLLITFEEKAPLAPPASPTGSQPQVEAAGESTLHQLQWELTTTREDLQLTIEELESSNEELKASNEEMTSMNEELQVANTRLETSRQELQSLNVELNAVNNQLHEKVVELETTNNDMANLLHSTDVATIFLDRSFRIKLFTKAAAKLFHLLDSDAGRSLYDITPRFSDPNLFDDAEVVLNQWTSREKEVATADGSWLVRRILPYCTRDNRIEGVVLTFVDITERKRAADAVVYRLAAIVESSVDAIFSKNLDGVIQTWNRGAERLFGYTAQETVGRSVEMVVPEDRVEEWDEIMARLRRGESVEGLETERVRKDGQLIPVRLTISPVRDSGGKLVSASSIARDISEFKRAGQELRDREEHLRAILNTATDAILTIDHSGIVQSVNPAAEWMFGYTAAEMIGQNVKMLMPSPYRDEHDGYLAKYLRTGEKRIIDIGREVQARRKDGSVFPVDLSISEIKHLRLFTGMIRDKTLRKELEREIVEIASLEQRRIGQDLHDSVGQELTALNLRAKDLYETLRSDPEKAPPLLEQMMKGLQRSQQELRAILRGLVPVPVDSEGLMAALMDLAAATRQEGKAACEFDCPRPVSVVDNLTATHLYLIAQEAVHNALKHARPRTIRINLEFDDFLILRVQDDGIGISAPPTSTAGLGLRIMSNRAAIIGAKLTIEPVNPTGTLVTCVLPRKHYERERHQEASQGPDRR